MNHATKITTAFRIIIIIVAALSIIVVTATSFIIPSFALTRFFNCTTAVANKVGNLTLESVDSCYTKKFPWEVAKTNQQQHSNNTTTTSVANSNNNNSREKLPLVDTGSSSGNDNYPSSSFTTTITTPMTTGLNLSSDYNYNNSSGSNRDFSATSSDVENNNNSNNSNNSNNDVVSYQNLSRLFQCFQQAAFDGDGLGLNEVASCYTQIFVGNNPPAPSVASNNSFNN
jgi:hypothetical protein